MQETERTKHNWVLVLIGGLCILAGVLAYVLVSNSDVRVGQDLFNRDTREIVPSETSTYESYGALIPDSVVDNVSDLRSELFDPTLTDIMAPLPMEGVEPAGVSEDGN